MTTCYNCKKEIQSGFKFCPHCGTNLDEKKCSNCGYLNEPNSKFCQECGTTFDNSLQEPIKIKTSRRLKEPEIVISEPVPLYGITVEFSYSSSQTFEFAVESAKKISGFKQFGDGKKSIYRVTVNDNEIESLDELIDNLKGWRNRKVYHNGAKTLWDDVFNYSYCYNQRKVSFKPHLYCFGYEDEYQFNIWGCIHTNLNFNEHSDLFTFGKWLYNTGEWQFDKEKIRHYLEKSIYQYRFCPVINLSLIEEVLNVFPEKVNPNKDKRWKYIENWGGQEGLPVKITRYGYEELVYMRGVTPVDKNTIILEMSKKMKNTLPITNI